ncbi:hypothetical protein V2J09_020135 [Rumex salicifolius]
MALALLLLGILERPTLWEVLLDLIIVAVPLWIAVIVGVVIGWSWKPRWANFTWKLCIPSFVSIPGFSSLKQQLPAFVPLNSFNGMEEQTSLEKPNSSSNKLSCVEEADLMHLKQLVEVKDGGPSWIPMMDRSTSTMSYQAWRRDLQNGPPQYRSRTVFEDATPELVRDFFWDDEFRFKWDDMLLQHKTLEECSITGTMIVHWVRKFPFFCSDREYVIGRRIWESNRSYYCVTKGVPNSSVPRRSKPRRVDVYYSSWCIRPAESLRDGQMTATEVILFHHEDMGIPWEIAKLGVRQGMWGAVKKIDPGLRAYHKERLSGASLSQCATLAQINTTVGTNYLKSLEGGNGNNSATESDNGDSSSTSSRKQNGLQVPKLLIVGGAIALACSLDQGLLTKAVIFGVARRFAGIGKKL